MTTGLIAGLCFTSAALARDGGAEHELAAYSRHHPAVHRAYPGGPGASPDQRAAFVAWVCGHIERQARGWKLPRAYFARLIWKESRFDPNAISHKGAEGIAQFMPATARLRGLEDPFDPESAITASARFLAELRDEFGNLGLAAASYNAGPGRVRKWRAGRSGLPAETKDYVLFITGHSALAWSKPELPKTAFVLEKGLSFQTACRKLQIRRAPRARYAYAYNNRGIGYGRNGDHARAIGLYDTAIEVRPKFAKAYYNRGGAYRALGKYDLAIADYTTAIGLKPKYATAYNNRGVAYQKKRDFDRAIADYDRAIRLDPKY
ncbi:MAG: transglycosylase SLT domain-containing protein, partial [Hyphomicrobiales bacterium]